MLAFIEISLVLVSVTGLSTSEQKQTLLSKFSKVVPLESCVPYQSVCANSTADLSFNVRFQAQCINECQREGAASACVGVNYRPLRNVCEVYNRCPTSYTGNEAGCSYFQNDVIADKKHCSVIIGECRHLPGVFILPGNDEVLSVASDNYRQMLFVTRFNQKQNIAVYNTTTFQQLGTISVPGASSQLYGMTVSPTENCIYVSEYASKKVYRVLLSSTPGDYTVSATSWQVDGSPYGVSMTAQKNVLVTHDSGLFVEYTSSGTIVRQILEGSDNSFFHAVEHPSGVLAVSGMEPNSLVRLLTYDGTVLASYGTGIGSGPGQLHHSTGLAVDKNGYILVCDRNNNRVLVMNPTASQARELPVPLDAIGRINGPEILWLDELRGRLYVGERSPPYRVLVFDNLFSIGAVFSP